MTIVDFIIRASLIVMSCVLEVLFVDCFLIYPPFFCRHINYNFAYKLCFKWIQVNLNLSFFPDFIQNVKNTSQFYILKSEFDRTMETDTEIGLQTSYFKENV